MHSLTIAEIVGGLFVLFIAGWIWWRLPQWQVARLTGLTEAKDQGELENNFRQTITQTVGGLVVLFGAAFAYVQFQEQRRDFAVQQQQFQLQQQAAHDLLISNQVSKGFEDLGSTSIMVRIGGIYALEGVMDTSSQYHQAVLEGLCAFVRENTKGKSTAPATDVQAVLTVIGRRAAGAGVVDLNGANLTGADLAEANLTSAFLVGANLTGAFLRDAQVQQIQLDQACGTNETLPRGLTSKPCPPPQSP